MEDEWILVYSLMMAWIDLVILVSDRIWLICLSRPFKFDSDE